MFDGNNDAGITMIAQAIAIVKKIGDEIGLSNHQDPRGFSGVFTIYTGTRNWQYFIYTRCTSRKWPGENYKVLGKWICHTRHYSRQLFKTGNCNFPMDV